MSNEQSKNTKYFIHSFIGILLMFGFGFIPPFEPLTPLGMKYIGILLGLIYLWSLVEMLWPSILALVAVVLTGQLSGAAITPKAFGGDTIILVILSLAVIYALTNTGMFNYVTNYLLSRKCFQGRPWILSATLLLTMYGLSALSGGNMALLFLLWELVYKIADQINMPRNHAYCGAMVMGIIMAYVAGSACLPFMPSYLFIVGMFQNMTGMASIPLIKALVMNLSIGVSMLMIYLLLIRFVARINISLLKDARLDSLLETLPPMNRRQKFSLFYLILFVILLILPGTVNLFSQGPLAATLSNLGTIGMCYLMFALLYIIRIDGEPILVFRDVAHQIQWEAVALMAVIFSFSPLITAEGTGVSQWLMNIVNPLLGGHSPYVFTLIIFFITLLLTNIANNTVVMVLMITIINVYAPQMTLNLPIMAFLMLFMSQTAFLLPASSIYGALVHSQAEIVSKRQLYICALLTMLTALLVMVLVAIPLGNILL